MEYRDSIKNALDLILADSVQTIDKDKALSKLKVWHEVLEDVSDDDINKGLKKYLNTNLDSLLPTCAQFRKLCVKPRVPEWM